MKIVIPYRPHTFQKIVHEDNHRYRTMICGRRFGKTIFAINEILKKALLKKGIYWYIAPFYGQAKEIAWNMLKKYAVTEIVEKFNEVDLAVNLKNGSIIKLKGADKPDSLRGVGLDGVILDEFADFKKNVWDLVIRPALTDTNGWAIFLGTPKGKLNQLYEMFIRDFKYEDTKYLNLNCVPILPHPDYSSYKFKTSDNPYILREEIESAKLELSLEYFSQEYEASFENYTGIIYKEFDTSKHIIENLDLEPWWNYYVGIDTGRYSAITFLVKDNEGKEYVFDEIYDFDSKVFDICEKIKYIINKYRIDFKRVNFFIDSASQVKREYEANGIFCIDSQKDIENQINQVRNRFANNSLFFLERCRMHIIEHQGYVWDIKSKKPMPVKENDHTCSSLQYIFSTYHLSKAINYDEIYKQKQTIIYKAIHENKFKKRNRFS